MNKGRKQPTISGLEQDIVYGRHYFCYTDNNPSIVRWVKRKMNKRYRQQLKEEMKKEEEL